MKYIKKVSVSDLVSNTGTIIDSMNPGDDQTLNAPSIHAVKEYIEKYSTIETKIGTWTDGKPIYRKVLTGTVTSTGYTNVTHNLSIDTVVNVKALCAVSGQSFASNGYRPMPYFGDSFSYYFKIDAILTNSISFRAGNWTNNTYLVILEYTKTTD